MRRRAAERRRLVALVALVEKEDQVTGGPKEDPQGTQTASAAGVRGAPGPGRPARRKGGL